MAIEQWRPLTPPDPSPLHRLREALAEARRQGEPFASAWPRCAEEALREVHPQRERAQWKTALNRTEETWERCYDRAPVSAVDRQLTLVAAERGVPDGRECAVCGVNIEHRHARAKYCGEQHRREHARAREPLKIAA
jgi:hypothetical protein